MEDIYRPSFFELIAQEQLHDLLQPVFRYVLAIFAQQHPRYLLQIYNRQDEAFALVMLIVQRHYLKNFSGSFTESFYELKLRKRPAFNSDRASAAMSLFTDREALTNKDINLSLFFLVGLPYLQSKARAHYEHLGGGTESTQDLFAEEPSTSSSAAAVAETASSTTALDNERQRLRLPTVQQLKDTFNVVFKKSYPYVSSAWTVWMVSYNIRYLFEKTPYYRPWLSLLGLDVRRMSMQDHLKASQNAIKSLTEPFQRDPQTNAPPSFTTTLFGLARVTPRILLDSLRVLLPTSIFLLKFLGWWYSSDRTGSRPATAAGKQTAPPLRPPSKLHAHPRGIFKDHKDPLPNGSCPICQHRLTNPTALHTGWVYDYKCVWQWVEQHGTCPVTLVPCTTSQIRKIIG